MAESESSGGQGQGVSEANEAGAQVAIDRIFLKDLSFESPQSPQIFRSEWKPEVSIDLNTRSARLDGDFFEVVLTITVTAKTPVEGEEAEAHGYIIEVQQGGVFSIRGIEGDNLRALLGTFCPNTLFPYVREVIDSTVAKGGFPPLQLAPFNFEALYQQAQAEAAAASSSGSTTAH